MPCRVGGHHFCSIKKCPSSFRDHIHGSHDAHENGWFLQRNGEAWCPKHVPDWVAEWRSKKKEKR